MSSGGYKMSKQIKEDIKEVHSLISKLQTYTAIDDRKGMDKIISKSLQVLNKYLEVKGYEKHRPRQKSVPNVF